MSSVVVSRDELYRKVWEIPMVRLAAQYGISGNGLAKICDRLMIPYPPRGYWARKAAGQRVVIYRLLPSRPETPADVRITASSPKEEPAPAGEEAAQRVARIQKEIGAVSRAPGRKLHSVIAGWITDQKERVEAFRRDRSP